MSINMNREVIECFECDSEYFSDSSKMGQLCPDCSSFLYGFPNCNHAFENGRCTKCYWNGKSSNYINQLKNETD